MMELLRAFLTALTFFTRLPVRDFGGRPEHGPPAMAWAPAIGWLIGGVMALAYAGAAQFLPQAPAVLLAIVVALLLTGALHEDGFADFCDGFGGGHTRDRILAIMKDPAVGVYGVLGLVLIVATRLLVLLEIAGATNAAASLWPFSVLPLEPLPLPAATMIAGHSISRFFCVACLACLDYARTAQAQASSSKIHSLVSRRPRADELLFAALCAGATLPLFGDWRYGLALVPCGLIFVWLVSLFRRRIGGYTGDLLGAIQQITEASFLIGVLALSGWTG
jgi:adenosylcobinamide-GDP ribazoletransferase